MKEQLQSLFEKISDAYPDGRVEQKFISDKYVDIRFLRATEETPGDLDYVEVGHVRLSIHNVVIENQDEGMVLVKIVDHYGGEEVYVSPVVSAITAIATR